MSQGQVVSQSLSMISHAFRKILEETSKAVARYKLLEMMNTFYAT